MDHAWLTAAGLPRDEQGAPLAQVHQDEANGVRLAPLSFAQERMWYVAQLAGGSAAYSQFFGFRLNGPVNVEALEQSLRELIRRHETLRTTFPSVEGSPMQVVFPDMPLTLRVEDLRTMPKNAREAEARRLTDEELQAPFDLINGPLMRTALFRLDEEEYVFVLTIHHILVDGWSMGVLFGDLGHYYKGFSTGHPCVLPQLPTQYPDFTVWQRQLLQREFLEKDLAYWKRQLAGLTPLEMPTDRPRPPVQTFRGRYRFLALPKALIEAIRALSGREKVTPFIVILAALQTLLHRYSGQEDIVTGSPIASRNRSDIEGLIGVFINMVTLRTDFSGDPTFRELLQRVKKVVVGAYEHQNLPFANLVEELQAGRDPSRSPLFQVDYAQGLDHWFDLELAGVESTRLELDNGTSKFDLSLYLADSPTTMRGWLEYSTDLFDSNTIERMTGHFQSLLEGMVANPERRVSRLPLLTQPERHQLLIEWNATRADYPQDLCLHQLIENQVERTPDAVAVVFEHKRLTYRELNRRSNQLAHYLRALGVGPELLVGISVERSLEMVVGLLGILKAGGAYVPLDPGYPKERLAFMLEDAHPTVLLTQEALLARLPPGERHVVCLDREWQVIAQQSEENLPNLTTPDNLAYVIYTSGSTGKPKGAMNIHRGITNRLLWMQDAYRLTEQDRILQKTPFSFDVSGWEFFWPMLAGARLVVARPEGHQDPAYLVRVVAEEGITTLHFVPSMLQVFLEERGLETCTSLKSVICSGEALTYELQERFFDRLDRELHNLYGPTEASIDVTSWACQRGSQRRIVPIGRPIANTQIYILDAHSQPVPIGVPGELHIGGVGLARGYLNRPELTAERFIPDPYSEKPGARLYKTGDVARFLPDGNIEYLGRMDHQVKMRGFRIELGEIESVLAQYPGVQQAVVVAREDTAGDKRLVAYIVVAKAEVEATAGQTTLTSSDSPPLAPQLRGFLQKQLPEYMVPSVFVMLDALPLTPSGKVDRRALPAPEHDRSDLEGGFVPPRTEMESLIAEIWRDLLQLDRISVYDNFLDLGGHSLLAMRVVGRLQKKLGVSMDAREVVAQTLEQFAQSCEERRRQAEPPEVEALTGRISSVFKRFSRSLKSIGLHDA